MNTQRIGEILSRLSRDISAIAAADVALWLLIALAVFLLIRLARRWIDRAIEDVNRRHRLRKAVGYAGTLVVLAVAVALFVGKFGHLATVLGLVGAGLAIALQDLGKSAAGWIYLASRSGFGPGSRVEVDGVLGDVVDIGILKTTVLEVGNIVYGRQSSGRLVTVPNSKFLSSSIHLSPAYSPYVWLEIPFLFTYESDWKRAVELLEELATREFAGVDRGTREAFEQLEKRFAFKYGARTPVVYVRTADSGVELTLRFLSHIRQRRGARDRVTRAMLEAVERDPGLDFAYPTMRIYRRGEPSPAE
ncbi:MAG: mechanosensitive ion channel family protein [Gemmatimonadota bacterium]